MRPSLLFTLTVNQGWCCKIYCSPSRKVFELLYCFVQTILFASSIGTIAQAFYMNFQKSILTLTIPSFLKAQTQQEAQHDKIHGSFQSLKLNTKVIKPKFPRYLKGETNLYNFFSHYFYPATHVFMSSSFYKSKKKNICYC